MNIENLNKLLAILKGEEQLIFMGLPVGFNMREYVAKPTPQTDPHAMAPKEPHCGTVACVAGIVCILQDRVIKVDNKSSYMVTSPEKTLATYLGIPYDDANAIALPIKIEGLEHALPLSVISRKMVVKQLETFRDTGKLPLLQIDAETMLALFEKGPQRHDRVLDEVNSGDIPREVLVELRELVDKKDYRYRVLRDELDHVLERTPS